MLFKISDSLYERARHFEKSVRYKKLATQLAIPTTQGISLETLEVLASIAAYHPESFDLVIDVGAHKGLFALPALQVLGATRAICFEPNELLHGQIAENLSGHAFEIYGSPLAAAVEERPFFLHADSTMSSLMPADFSGIAEDFANTDQLPIVKHTKTSTLDSDLKCLLPAFERAILKLDTQGNELDVLRGGTAVLRNCDAVLTEYMFTSPYKRSSTLEDLLSFLSQHGFYCAAALSMTRKRSHRISAVDFLFLKAA